MTTKKKIAKSPEYWLNSVNTISTSFNLALRDIEAILKVLAKKLVKELGAYAVAIWTVEEKTNFMKIEASVGLSQGYIRYFNQTDRIRVGKGLVGKVMSGRKTLYTLDPKNEKLIDVVRWRKIVVDEGFRATISVPMFVGKKIVGAFSVYYKSPVLSVNPYQIQFIEIIANQIAITIENIKGYETIKRYGENLFDQVEKLLHLQKVTESFSLDFYKSTGKSLAAYANYIIERFNASGLSIFQLEKEKGILRMIAAYGLSKSHQTYLKKHSKILRQGSLIGLALKDKKIKTSAKVFIDQRIDKHWRTLLSIERKSALAVFPLVVRDEEIGAVVVYHDKPHVFSEEEIGILSMLAYYIGISLLNIRIFNSLTSEQQKMACMINSLDDGLIVYDLKGRITAFNPRAEEFLWLIAKDVIGKHIEEKFEKKSVYWKNLCNINRLVQLDYASKEYTTEGPQKLVLEITYVPVRDQHYRKVGAMQILHNITKEKEVELLKSSFVSTASHQLRTPLSAIKWSLDILAKEDLGDLNPKQRELVKKTFTANQHLINLVNDLLDVSRIEEGRFGYNFSLGNLEKLTEKIFNELKIEAQRRQIGLKFKKPKAPLPQVSFDSNKLNIAIRNIIDNAIKYTLAKGFAHIRFQVGEKSLFLIIEDNGIGIPKKDQKFVFIKFFRAKNAVKLQTEGSGLGLYIAKKITEKHNVILTFESEENKGSIFTFQFPLDPKRMPKGIARGL